MSHFHRIKSDEMWHHYVGEPLTIHIIDPAGKYIALKIGKNSEKREHLQKVVPAGCWFGECLKNPQDYALVGCTVAPGFDFADFALGNRKSLLSQFPQHSEIIKKLT